MKRPAIAQNPNGISRRPASPCSCLSKPLQMLVRIARQSRIGNPDACATVLTLLYTGRLLHQRLQRVLARLDLSEVKLTTLVSLYAVDPEPSTPADLAANSQVSRATMTETLDSMSVRRWVVRNRARSDRRVLHINLTEHGRAVVEGAVRPFLSTIDRCSQTLTAEECAAALRICAQLRDDLPSDV